MSTIKIRLAGRIDSKSLADIHHVVFDPAWDKRAMLSLLDNGAQGWLASSATQDVGFSLVRVAADEAELLSIGVLPEACRQGIGGKLLEMTCLGAHAAGATALFLDVAADNIAACHLYEHHGFVRIGKRPNYYANGADALTFRRSLE